MAAGQFERITGLDRFVYLEGLWVGLTFEFVGEYAENRTAGGLRIEAQRIVEFFETLVGHVFAFEELELDFVGSPRDVNCLFEGKLLELATVEVVLTLDITEHVFLRRDQPLPKTSKHLFTQNSIVELAQILEYSSL